MRCLALSSLRGCFALSFFYAISLLDEGVPVLSYSGSRFSVPWLKVSFIVSSVAVQTNVFGVEFKALRDAVMGIQENRGYIVYGGREFPSKNRNEGDLGFGNSLEWSTYSRFLTWNCVYQNFLYGGCLKWKRRILFSRLE